jgi:hypothetical protein
MDPALFVIMLIIGLATAIVFVVSIIFRRPDF